MKGAWSVRLVAASEQDYLEVIKRIANDFGTRPADVYAQTLALAIDAMREDGPKTLGVKEREEIGSGVFTLHAARHRRKASHFLVFGVREIRTVEILRILHDRMDLARHMAAPQELPRH